MSPAAAHRQAFHRTACVAAAVLAICAHLQAAQELPPLRDAPPPETPQNAPPGARPTGLPEPPRAEGLSRTDYDRQFPRWLAQGRLREALSLAERFLDSHPSDPQVLFDACRVSSLLGDGRASAAFALRALHAGWLDDEALDTHPDLRRLREHDAWPQVVELRSTLRPKDAPHGGSSEPPAADDGADARPPDARARASLAEWMQRFGGGRYRVEADDELGLIIASALSPDAVRRTRTALGLLARQEMTHLFGQRQQDTVLLVLVAPADAPKVFDDPAQGGIYHHHLRRLLACSTGAILRHEYTHVLHRGHMQRLGQAHPIWIVEGLATLFEDWTLGPAGTTGILPNHRTAEAYDRVRQGATMPWREFFAQSEQAFMSDPRWNYAQARSMLEFLANKGLLGVWYRDYTEGWAEDPTGLRAFERVLRCPIATIEAQWHDWVIQRGRQDGTVQGAQSVLGVLLSNRPEGVRVDSLQAGGPAQQAGLERGDYLKQVAGQEVRSVGDALMALASLEPGEKVEVRLLRGSINATVWVNLAPDRAVPP